MDYSDVSDKPIPVVATWQFQWNILHENLPTVTQWKENKRKEKTNQQITKKSQEDGKANNHFISNAYDNKQL